MEHTLLIPGLEDQKASPDFSRLRDAIVRQGRSDRCPFLELFADAEIVRRLLPCLVRPFESKDWWGKVLALLAGIADAIPCYILHFDKTGGVVDVVRRL